MKVAQPANVIGNSSIFESEKPQTNKIEVMLEGILLKLDKIEKKVEL